MKIVKIGKKEFYVMKKSEMQDLCNHVIEIDSTLSAFHALLRRDGPFWTNKVESSVRHMDEVIELLRSKES